MTCNYEYIFSTTLFNNPLIPSCIDWALVGNIDELDRYDAEKRVLKGRCLLHSVPSSCR